VIHQYSPDETLGIHERILKGLANNKYWVVATTYEWGCAQLGLPTPNARAIFIEYSDVKILSHPNCNGQTVPSPPVVSPHHGPMADGLKIRPLWEAKTFDAAIARAKQGIKEGDVYQLNLSYPLTLTSTHAIQDVYRHMCAQSYPSHGAFIQTNQWGIASASPEELFYMNKGRIRTQPIKGTVGRHANPKRDEQARQALLSSEKDHAELLMITDLMRHDVGQLAAMGTVQVPTLCQIQPFHYVYHLVSTITAELNPGVTGFDALRALAPGGSITGCPKVSACQYIHQIEPFPRGFYTGHIGFISPTGEAAFNVAIRTCYQGANGPIKTHTGCGITIDSNAADEYQESLDKLGFLSPFTLEKI
jgi:para-aminobenzoate synthetase component 1